MVLMMLGAIGVYLYTEDLDSFSHPFENVHAVTLKKYIPATSKA